VTFTQAAEVIEMKQLRAWGRAETKC